MSASSLLKELWMEAPLKPPSLDRISDDLEPSSVEAASLIFTHTAWYRFLQFWIFCCKLSAQNACWCPWPLQQILDNETLGREEETTMWLTLQFTEHPNLQEGIKHQLSQLLILRGEKNPFSLLATNPKSREPRNFRDTPLYYFSLTCIITNLSRRKRSLLSPNTMNGRSQKSNCTWKNVIERLQKLAFGPSFHSDWPPSSIKLFSTKPQWRLGFSPNSTNHSALPINSLQTLNWEPPSKF